MNEFKKVLIVDDNATIRDSCRQVLERAGFEVDEAASGEKGIVFASDMVFHLILLDLKMPEMDGFETLKRLKAANPDTPVVVITGYPTIQSSVEAMRQGASDFIPKPFTPEVLRVITEKVLKEKHLRDENEYLRTELTETKDRYSIVGNSAEIRTVHDLVKKIAPTGSTVLITGESGTGKELFARALHRYSDRASEPFVVVDCGTLVGTLFESELFGHTKGAFTGANATTRGRFEIADGGTIFFDEISNIEPQIQAKLLRVIQEREFNRVGSNQVIKVGVRIIAATNADLLKSVNEGTFREDLYYRLCVVPVMLPPLRQHKEDIPMLADYFLRKYSLGRNKNVVTIDGDVLEIFMANDWPGNVRELENTIERAVILTATDSIRREDILHYAYSVPRPSENPLNLKSVEAAHIKSVLKQTGGNKGLSAKFLGIDRKTLWRKINKYAIET
jgi:two-component system response regulator HydG